MVIFVVNVKVVLLNWDHSHWDHRPHWLILDLTM